MKHINVPKALVALTEIVATLIAFMLLYNMIYCKTLVELLQADMNSTY